MPEPDMPVLAERAFADREQVVFVSDKPAGSSPIWTIVAYPLSRDQTRWLALNF